MNSVLYRYGKVCCAKLVTVMLMGLLGAVVCAPALAKSKVHTVTIEGMKFSPEVLEVDSGDTVVWHNKDIVPHNVTATNQDFHSPTISPNGKWTFKPRKKGEYSYQCTLHPTMKAELIVR